MAADRPLDEVLAALALGQNRRFEFTDLQWNAIQASLGTSRLRPVIRLQLEMLVGAFRQHAPALPSTDEKKALQQVGRQAKLLLKKFDHLPGKLAWVLGFSTILTADPPGSERSLSTQQIEEQWAYFRRNLKSLVANSEQFASVRRGAPANVDLDRNDLWDGAAHIYQAVTGRPPRASQRPDLGGGHLPASGPFVRFICVLTAAIPGEKIPTGDEIRGWIRAYWKPRTPPPPSL